jgi:hypothetical protein
MHSEFQCFSEVAPTTNMWFARANLKRAAEARHPQALHALAVATYRGFLAFKKSSREAYRLFLGASVAGHHRSTVAAARMRLAGDGVPVDCPRAVAMLRRVTGAGPWTTFLRMYSTDHARAKAVSIDAADPDLSRAAAVRFALHAPFPDAIEWAAGMQVGDSHGLLTVLPVKYVLFARAMWAVATGRMRADEWPMKFELLGESGFLESFAHAVLIVTIAIALVFFTGVRLNSVV